MKTLKITLLICILCGCCSCATIFCGSKRKITFDNSSKSESEIPPVTLTIGNETHSDVSLPYTTKIKMKGFPITIVSSAAGYESDTLQLQRKFNAVSLLDIPFYAPISFPVDAITGAIKKPAEPDRPLVMTPIEDITQRDLVVSVLVRKRQQKARSESNFANHFRVGVGLAKWTKINGPTNRLAFSAGYGRTFNLIKDDIVLEPTLGIALKGLKYTEALGSIMGSSNLTREDTGTGWYAEIIIPMRYVLGLGQQNRKNNISVGVGPYFGIGLGGTYSTLVTGSGGSSTRTDRDYFGDEGAGVSRFDMGFFSDIRYSFSHLFFGVEILRGQTALSQDDTGVKNFATRLYIGYRF